MGRRPNLKNVVKKFLSADETRPFLSKAHMQEIDGVTYYAYCDGFKLAWSPIDFDFGVNESEHTIRFGNLINTVQRKRGVVAIDTAFKTALETFIKEHKKRERLPFVVDYKGYTIHVNPYYLKACLDFTEATELVIDIGNECAPLFMYGKENRNALVLPIRK